MFLFSCNNFKSDCSDLKADNSVLQTRIDSLENSNKNLTTQLQKNGAKVAKKQSKKNKISYNPSLSESKQQSNTSSNNSAAQSSSLYSTPRQKKSSSYSGQCMAITKKGTRCSRNARSGRYCWQHGG